MAHDVFISYSSKDKSVADALCATLESQGIRCWIAPRDIAWGADYGEAIVDGINESHAMVLVFSSHANASPHITREVDRAVSKGVIIIPVRIEDVAPAHALEYYISSVHWLDAIPPVESHFRALAEKIRPLLGRAEAERPAPAPTVQVAPAPLPRDVSSAASPRMQSAPVPPSETQITPAHTVARATDAPDATHITPPARPRVSAMTAIAGAAIVAALVGVLWLQPWTPRDKAREEAIRTAKVEEERSAAAAREAQLAEDARRREAIRQAEATRQAAEEAAKRAETAAMRLDEARKADEAARRLKQPEGQKRAAEKTAPVNPAPVARLDPAAAKNALEQKLRRRGLLKQSSADRWGVVVDVGGGGVVTLTGVLQNAEQRNETVRLASEIPGVTGVKQQINVQQSWR